MKSLTASLWEFWSQFECDGKPVPAYQDGAVPNGAEFPYITFTPVRGRAFSTLPAYATVWCKYTGENSAAGIAQRIAIMDAIARAIPETGVRIHVPGGFVVMNRGSGDFLSGDTDPDDKTILVGRVICEITFYYE